MYFAIIGDIINSKKLSNRTEIQEKLDYILEQINIDYSDDIAANFLITLGDEFQGLLLSSKYLFEIIDKIKFYMYPIIIRFGVGIGNIDTKIKKEMALGADGPAYHHARKMIDEIKFSNKSNSKISDSTNIKIKATDEDIIVSLINNNLCLCSFIESKWTDKQRVLIQKVIFSIKTQREIAKEFELVQSSVQRRLKHSGYYDYIHVKQNINNILLKVWGNDSEH